MIVDVKCTVASNRFMHARPLLPFNEMSIFNFFVGCYKNEITFWFLVSFFDGCFLRSIIMVRNGTRRERRLMIPNQENWIFQNWNWIETSTGRIDIWFAATCEKMFVSSKLNWNYYSCVWGVMSSQKKSNHLLVKTNCYRVIMVVFAFWSLRMNEYVFISQSS